MERLIQWVTSIVIIKKFKDYFCKISEAKALLHWDGCQTENIITVSIQKNNEKQIKIKKKI